MIATKLGEFYRDKDKRWLSIWVAGLLALWIWDLVFLNAPALARIEAAFVNTLYAGALVVFMSLVFGWAAGVGLHFLDEARNRSPYIVLTFFLNVIRSIPQIVGILIGYVVITFFIEQEALQNQYAQLFWMSFVISLFVFLEVVDLVRDRIRYFAASDFYPAMLCCGIRESRIVNIEVLWKNSRAHLIHKLIAIFGSAIFLQCSIDFIISVGLSTDVSSTNFPVTLGSLLAKMDSKQDILAIGSLFGDLSVFGRLLTEHLQGVSVAVVIVFSLLCIYQISNGFVKRNSL
ncbi:MAG: Binding-protein-dependent transport system inner rane component [Bacteroidetes bacterium]|nr:Binding-protein-dependent transport system inner rane component [Bacteroidota bacterium]